MQVFIYNKELLSFHRHLCILLLLLGWIVTFANLPHQKSGWNPKPQFRLIWDFMWKQFSANIFKFRWGYTQSGHALTQSDWYFYKKDRVDRWRRMDLPTEAVVEILQPQLKEIPKLPANNPPETRRVQRCIFSPTGFRGTANIFVLDLCPPDIWDSAFLLSWGQTWLVELGYQD